MRTVLFTSKCSNYAQFSNISLWDEERNALDFCDPVPVIAHPPCRLFGKLRAFSTAPGCERFLAYAAISHIRRFGGILEHPLSSTLWGLCQVGKPLCPDAFGGYLVRVDLSDFGFPARKPTGLYIVGLPYSKLPAPPLPTTFPVATVSSVKNGHLPEIPKKMRSVTPVAMCGYLLNVLDLIQEAAGGDVL